MPTWRHLPFEIRSMILSYLIHSMVNEATTHSKFCQFTYDPISFFGGDFRRSYSKDNYIKDIGMDADHICRKLQVMLQASPEITFEASSILNCLERQHDRGRARLLCVYGSAIRNNREGWISQFRGTDFAERLVYYIIVKQRENGQQPKI